MNLNGKQLLLAAILGSAVLSTLSFALPTEDETYCLSHGGTVENMVAEFNTRAGTIEGFTKSFCTFNLDNGFIAVGLETLSSKTPNIAASFIKTLPRIEKDSPLWRGKYENPGLNVCRNLGGGNIAYHVASGGFKNHLGQSDICVFGDGSMVSSWSLIYIANGRNDYYKVRDAVQPEPMVIKY